MPVATDWKTSTAVVDLCEALRVTTEKFRRAVRESKFNYVEPRHDQG